MRIAYVKSGHAVAALGRLAASGADLPDDGGPDGFLGDLLRTSPEHRFLVIGVSRVAPRNARDSRDARVRGLTFTTRGRFGRSRTALRLLGTLLRFRPERVICGKCGFPLWVSYLAARTLRVPLYHSRHNFPEQPTLGGRLTTLVDNAVTRRADAVLCHGPYLRDRLAATGVAPDRIFEFDSGNEALLAAVDAAPGDTEGAKKRVLFVGRVVRDKGVLDLLEACVPLLRRDPELELVYAGEGPDLKVLRAAAAGSGVAAQVRFLGRVAHTEVGVLMRGAAVVATPTRSSFPEGRCMVAMEALAVGVPVVAPRSGPFPYLVRHGVNGLLYTPDAVDELADCMRRLLTDPTLQRELAGGARASGEQLRRPQVTFAQALARAMAAAGHGVAVGSAR